LTVSGTRVGVEPAAARQAPPSGAGEEREPVAEQVERRDAARRARRPEVRDPAPEVALRLEDDVGLRPVRTARAGHVVLADRPAFGLVGVEQRLSRPAAQDPGRDVLRTLYSSAQLDEQAVGGAVRRWEAERAAGMARLARRLREDGALRAGVAVEQAEHTLWVLTC
jgi:hypothetical protein